MLTFNPASLRAAPGDAAANLGAGAALMPGADPAGFASLLRQSQTVRAAPPTSAPVSAESPNAKPATTAASAADDGPNEAAAPPDSNDPISRSRALARAKLRAADGAAPNRDAKGSSVVAADAKAGEAAERRLDNEPADGCDAPQTQLVANPSPVDPSLMHWLAGLERTVSGRSDAAPTDTDGQAGADDTDPSAVDARSPAKGRRPADLEAAAYLKDQAARGQSRLTDTASAGQFASVQAEQAERRLGDAPAQPLIRSVDRRSESAAASAASFASIPAAGTDITATAAVAIATPVTAPDFAQELGLRMAVLAKDGVQTAELHLNPADMGPVSVQIVMDGTQAHVDFGADIAATRQAIEAGLPALASALADAGFTLAGGGVSQHAGGRHAGHDSSAPEGRPARGSAVDDDLTRVAAAARRIVTNGGVDLFV